jgi:hypothetical protein
MRYDIWYIAIALLMLLGGEVFGEWMAANRDHSFALVHAHVSVIGWASFALFGLIHHAFPTLAASRLALPQFLIAVLSTLFFVGGLWMVWAVGEPLAALLGSYALMLATVLFIVMFFKRVVFAG